MKIVITFLLTIFVFTVFGQTADNTDRHNNKNIYYQALVKYLDFMSTDSFYSKLPEIDTLYIYGDTKTTDSLLDHIGSTAIIMIEDPYTFIKDQKKQGITLYSIFPLEYQNGEFSVSFVPFDATVNKKTKRLLLSNPGSYKVVFKFDNNQFHHVRIEDYGI